MIYHIYTNKDLLSEQELIEFNDAYFNVITYNDGFTEPDKRIMEKIDNAQIIDINKIETPYGIGAITNLSTGCKTLINILHNSNKVINISECGENAVNLISELNIPDVYLYMPFMQLLNMCDGDTAIINNNTSVHNLKEYKKWWHDYYDARYNEEV
jgi:hypothetical protein